MSSNCVRLVPPPSRRTSAPPARIPFLDSRERGSDLRCRRRVKRLEPTPERARSVGPDVLDYAHDSTTMVTDTLPAIKDLSSTRRGWAAGGMTNLSWERSRYCNKAQPDQVPSALIEAVDPESPYPGPSARSLDGGKRVDLLGAQYLARIAKAGGNVLVGDVRVVPKHIRLRPAITKQPHNELDRQASPSNDRLPGQDGRVDGDSV